MAPLWSTGELVPSPPAQRVLLCLEGTRQVINSKLPQRGRGRTAPDLPQRRVSMTLIVLAASRPCYTPCRAQCEQHQRRMHRGSPR